MRVVRSALVVPESSMAGTPARGQFGSWREGWKARLRFVRDRFWSRGLRRRELEGMVVLCFAFSRALRSGLPVTAALSDSLNGIDVQLLGRVRRIIGQVESGRPLSDAVDEWIATSDSASERLIGQAVRFASVTGGELATCIDAAGLALREQLAVETRRRVLTAQASSSAAVLVSLPLVFGVFSSLLRGGPIHNGLTGLALAAVGATLDVLGLLWMKHLRRSLL